MSQRLQIHPETPQKRLVRQLAERLAAGQLIVYPTDSGYAFGCQLGNKSAMTAIRQMRQLGPEHNFTLVCRDLSEISQYAKLNNVVFRTIKAHTPGAYTFILPATKEVPRRLQHPKRKTIGLRIPDNTIALSLLEALDQPIMSSTLILPGQSMPLTDVDDIVQALGKQVDVIVDAGYCGSEPTTVVEFIDSSAQILRVGQGDPSPFES